MTGPRLLTEDGFINYWATECILLERYPRAVPSDAITALESRLWEPEFKIESAGDDRSSLSWTAPLRGWRQYVFVTEVTIDGHSIPILEPRSWRQARRGTIQLPVSSDRLRSALVEIDLIIIQYDHSRYPNPGKAAVGSHNNGASTLEDLPVDLNDQGLPVLIPSYWKRSLTRTVNPGPESD